MPLYNSHLGIKEIVKKIDSVENPVLREILTKLLEVTAPLSYNAKTNARKIILHIPADTQKEDMTVNLFLEMDKPFYYEYLGKTLYVAPKRNARTSWRIFLKLCVERGFYAEPSLAKILSENFEDSNAMKNREWIYNHLEKIWSSVESAVYEHIREFQKPYETWSPSCSIRYRRPTFSEFDYDSNEP